MHDQAKSRLQKALALLLTLCMVLSLLPAAAAEEPAKIEDTDTDVVVWGEAGTEYTDAEGQTTHYSTYRGLRRDGPLHRDRHRRLRKKAFNGPILKAVIDGERSADVDLRRRRSG